MTSCTQPSSVKEAKPTHKEDSTNSVASIAYTILTQDTIKQEEPLVSSLPPTPIYKVLVVPCANGYDYGTKGYDLEKELEAVLSTLPSVKVLPFSYKKMRGTHYHGVFDKKYCKDILERTQADFLLLNRFTQAHFSSKLEPHNWGYHTKLVAVKTQQQIASISVTNLSSFKAIQEHIHVHASTLQQDLEKLQKASQPNSNS